MNSEKTPEDEETMGEAELDELVEGALGVDDELFDDDHPEGSEASAVGNVVPLLPVHAAPHAGGKSKGAALKVTRRAGRQREVRRMPTTSDLEYHAQMAEAKAEFIDKDPVFAAIARHADSMDILATVRQAVAKEAAALHFQRIENEKYGKDTAQVSTRRIDALKKIADIELEIKKLGGANIDVHSEKMQRIFKFFVDTVRSTLEGNLSPEQIDLVFNRLSTEFEGWQEKLSEVLR